MGLKTTVKRYTNELQNMMGYFKKQFTADKKQVLIEVINEFHRGLVPLIVPVTLSKP